MTTCSPTSASALLFAMLFFPAQGLAQEVDSLQQVRELYDQYTPENFDDGGPISHYVWRNFPAFFPHATVARTAAARPLQEAPRQEVRDFRAGLPALDLSLDQYVHSSPLVDGLIVLQAGEVIYESYPHMAAYERHLGWSITKVVVSTALAALQHQGRVDVEAAIETYVPALADTAWAGISLRNIANMASGIACLDSDGYQNTEACIYRYEETLGLTAPANPPQSTLDSIRAMRVHRGPGERYEYVSANTFVTGLVVENITGQPLWLALQQLLWQGIGAEADAMLMISPQGIAASHGGLSARLRDVARFGQIFTRADLGIIGPAHLRDLRSDRGIGFGDERLQSLGERFPDDVPQHAAWQWDMIWADGAMFKGGYSGQGIYVDPERDLVAAWYGTDSSDGERNKLLSMVRRLATSDLFDPR